MSIQQLNPYLHVNGTAEKAIKLYESALGATVEHVLRYGDFPEMAAPPERKNLVMHAVLRSARAKL